MKMFVTFFKNEFKIHDAASGNVMYVKSIADEIVDAQLSGNQLIVTTKKRTEVYRRIGNTFAFSFFKSYNH